MKKKKSHSLKPMFTKPTLNKVYYNPFYHLGVCRGMLGTGLLKGCGTRPFWLAVSKGSRTKKNTWLFLKLKVFMPEMKLNFYLGKRCANVYKAKNTASPGVKSWVR